MHDALFRLLSPTLRYTGVTLQNPHAAVIPKGVTAVIGPTGAGKTRLAEILQRGRNFMTNSIKSGLGEYPRVRSIVFNDIHSLAGFKVEYYQQRYEASMNDEVPTVAEAFGDRMQSPLWRDTIERLHITDFADKRLNYLSSGELRKILVANMLFDLPQVLILDNPFIGLDAPSRRIVAEMVGDIAGQGISVLLLVSDTADIPECATAGVPIRGMTIGETIIRAEGESIEAFRRRFDYLFDFAIDESLLAELVPPHSGSSPGDTVSEGSSPGDTDIVVSLRHCRVAYGSRTLIDNISWDIRRGECWALSGPNGSGKSTLLSIINADNPQAYSNDVWLFGRKRGVGRSIWDIKSRIGFLSSELHLYYGGVRNSARTVVGEGFNRALGLFDPITEAQAREVDRWMRLLGMDSIGDVCFNNLSAGHQRLVLLLRALVRRPELLILDEPVHGLDQSLKAGIRKVVAALAAAGSTIIYVTHCPEELPVCITHHKVLSVHQPSSIDR